MAAYSNVLAYNADTETLGVASDVLAYNATTELSGLTGVAAFAASLVVAFSGTGTVANPVASNVIAYDATTQAYASNVLAYDAATASEVLTGTGAFSVSFTLGTASAGSGGLADGVENTGSGQDFPLSLAYSFSGDGTAAQPQSVTGSAASVAAIVASSAGAGEAINPQIVSGSGSQALSLSTASTGAGTLEYSFTGSGSQSVSLLVASDGDGSVAEPSTVTGTGSFSVGIAYTWNAGGTEAVPFHMGEVFSTPLVDAPTVLRARLSGRPNVYTATLESTVNFPGVS